MEPRSNGRKRRVTVGPRLIAAGAAAVALLLLAAPIAGASFPAFFSASRSAAKSYDSLQASSHKGLACGACHADPRGPLVYRFTAAADFYASLAGKRAPALEPKFGKPRNEACLECHRTDWSDDTSRTSRIPHPAHLRVAGETRECVKCHKWTAHEELEMQKHKKMPFSGVCVAYGCHVGTKSAEECGSCHHLLRETGREWKADHPRIVQATGPNGCLESCHDIAQCRLCHTTGKRPKFSGLAAETGLKAIEALHVKATWGQQHGAEGLKDQAKCMKCHVSDGECRACHARRPAFHGSEATWIGSHKNLKPELEKNPRRCLTCHKKPWCEDCHKQFKEMR